MTTTRGRVRVGVLVSGSGTNLAALLERSADAEFPAEVVIVASNRPSAGGLQVAKRHNVDAVAMPVAQFGGDTTARDIAMRETFLAAGVELVVTAGYDRVLADAFLSAFPDAMLNVHPSLLPAFGGGMTGVSEALDYGVKIAGCTVQLLEPGEPDGGAIILQAAVPILEDDDLSTLHDRIHQQEWLILPEAVALWAEGRLRREGRRIRILPPHMAGTPGLHTDKAMA